MEQEGVEPPVSVRTPILQTGALPIVRLLQIFKDPRNDKSREPSQVPGFLVTPRLDLVV